MELFTVTSKLNGLSTSVMAVDQFEAKNKALSIFAGHSVNDLKAKPFNESHRAYFKKRRK